MYSVSILPSDAAISRMRYSAGKVIVRGVDAWMVSVLVTSVGRNI